MGKSELYASVLEQVQALIKPETDVVCALANVASIVFYALNKAADADARLQHLPVNWAGFYMMRNPTTLVLGPFQGKVACQEIRVGKGVCGMAVLKGKTEVVEDVHAFPGHIACDAESHSEIVVPIRAKSCGGRLVAILDIDSTNLAQYDMEDAAGLEALCAYLGETLSFPDVFGATASTAATARPVGHPTKAPSGAVTSTFARGDMPTRSAAPVERTVHACGWTATTHTLNMMMNSAQLEEMETRLGIAHMPEILFESNTVALRHNASGIHVTFSAYEALALAARFYASDQYGQIKDTLNLPMADAWKTRRVSRGLPTHDAHVDWAFRMGHFFGLWKTADGSVIDVPFAGLTEGGTIDMDLLKRTDVPIRLYDSVDLFEDELHDCGSSKVSVRLRVMDEGWLVLVRQYIRVDTAMVELLDCRIFHKGGSDCVVFQTTHKGATIKVDADASGDGKGDSSVAHASRKYINPDDVMHLLEERTPTRTYTLPLA